MKKRKTTTRLILALLAIIAGTLSILHAAPPQNDNFASPIILSGFPTNSSGSNVDATLEQNEPKPRWESSVDRSVWYRWTATTDGPIKIYTLSDFDNVLAVWVGNDLSNLSEITANDDFYEENGAVFIDATAGVTYQIVVYGLDGEVGSTTINIAPDDTSWITGTLTGPDENTPLQGIEAFAERVDSNTGYEYFRYASIPSDANGNYSIRGLPAGTYRVGFEDKESGNYMSEFYDDAPDYASSIDIVVAAETTVTGIDASLANASRISGTLTGPDQTTPLYEIEATAYRWNVSFGYWERVTSVDSDADGNYIIGGLSSGTYRVEFRDWENGNYLPEVYPDAPDLDSGTDIVVAAETTVTGIDASLANASRISGTLTGPDQTTPLNEISATAYRWNASFGYWDWVSSAISGADGNYSIGGLPAGTYRVKFEDWKNGNYNTEFYPDAPNLHSGTDIVVAAGTTVTGINASLANGSRISGTLTGPDQTTPLNEITAIAYRRNASFGYWEGVSAVYSDADGKYRIGGLPAGTYRVEFLDSKNGNYTTEVYPDAPNLNSGTDIVVAAGATVIGIDASLASTAPPQPPAIVLFKKTSAGQFELHYSGVIGKTYILQGSSSLSEWTDIGLHTCQSGINIIPINSTASSMFWRLKTTP